jgi:predicted secreted hydrolase
VDLLMSRASPATGFDLAIRGSDDSGVPSANEPWHMAGTLGRDSLAAATDAFAIDLVLSDVRAGPVLHDEDGWVDFGAAGGSYYYSRTRMAATGGLTLDGATLRVEGTAWFDHQWGDFIAVGGGGWDWFAVNLDDGTDLTVSLVRDADGSYPLVYGTLVRADGSVHHLPRDAFAVQATGAWTSPGTGATYPSGWTISVPADDLTIRLTPTLSDQELDTRATTGVVYWEGSQLVQATRAGEPIGGEAYVELTGYLGD